MNSAQALPDPRFSLRLRCLNLRAMTAVAVAAGLVVPPGMARAQTMQPGAGSAAQEIPATIELMSKGGLFFPGSSAATVLPGQQVAAEVSIDVKGMVARTTVTQHFANPRNEWVEALYVFPLPETSAVDRLKLTVGERVIQGKITEHEQAKQQFEAARAAGQTASMLSQERPNIFTNAVTNIGPGETVSVQIGFEVPVDYHYDAKAGPKFSIRFPMAITPRYIPGEPLAALQASYNGSGNGWAFDTDQVPDASRITPPVNAPDAPKGNPVTLQVDLAAGFPVADIASSYHTITTKAAEDHYEIALAKGAVPADRDFELTWTPAPGATPSVGLFSEPRDGHDHHMVVITPPTPSADDAEAPKLPREVTFILDKSGSMSGVSIQQAKNALAMALKRLDPADRFEVIVFDSDYKSLFGHTEPADTAHVEKALRWIEGIEADGGTEMMSALREALDNSAEGNGMLRQIVFITDGAVGNEDALFHMVEKDLRDRRLFTVGIGSAPNGHFMREMANAGRGTFTFIGDTDQVGERMEKLFSQLATPVLTDIDAELPPGAEIYPPLLPDLYQGEPVKFVFRVPEGTAGEVKLHGKYKGHDWNAAVPVTAPGSLATHAGVASLWGRQKIGELERIGRRSAPGESLQQAITTVALNYELLSRYTSLIAVDAERRRPAEASLTSGSVAGNMPHGNTMGMPNANVSPAASGISPISAPTNPFSAGNLPKTATSAELLSLIGMVLSLIGGLLLLLRRRLQASIVARFAA
jgi:Ca-activated chloride channel homolog